MLQSSTYKTGITSASFAMGKPLNLFLDFRSKMCFGVFDSSVAGEL